MSLISWIKNKWRPAYKPEQTPSDFLKNIDFFSPSRFENGLAYDIAESALLAAKLGSPAPTPNMADDPVVFADNGQAQDAVHTSIKPRPEKTVRLGNHTPLPKDYFAKVQSKQALTEQFTSFLNQNDDIKSAIGEFDTEFDVFSAEYVIEDPCKERIQQFYQQNHLLCTDARELDKIRQDAHLDQISNAAAVRNLHWSGKPIKAFNF